jgi:hypothetical protein
MNFQALHFSSEEDSDDSSVDSYESSDEEGGMVGGSAAYKKHEEFLENFTDPILHMIGDILHVIYSNNNHKVQQMAPQYHKFVGIIKTHKQILIMDEELEYPFLFHDLNYEIKSPIGNKEIKFRLEVIFHEDTFIQDVKTFFESFKPPSNQPNIYILQMDDSIHLPEKYYNGLNVVCGYNDGNSDSFVLFELRFHTLETFIFKEIPNHDLEYLLESMEKYSKEEHDNYFPDNIGGRVVLFLNDQLDHMKNAIPEGTLTTDDNNSTTSESDDETSSIDFLHYITEPAKETPTKETPAKVDWDSEFEENQNYKVFTTDGDGNCFFYSLIQALKTVGIFTTVTELRQIVSDQMDDTNLPDYQDRPQYDPEYKKPNDIQHLKQMVLQNSFWADEHIISMLEKIMNIKFILVSDNKRIKKTLNESKQLYNPDYFIIFSFKSKHYNLITYKGKGALKLHELPDNLKRKILNDENAGIYESISGFNETNQSEKLFDQLHLENHPYKTILYFLILTYGEELLKTKDIKVNQDFKQFQRLYESINSPDNKKKYEEIMKKAISKYMDYNIHKLKTFTGKDYLIFFKKYYTDPAFKGEEGQGQLKDQGTFTAYGQGMVTHDHTKDIGFVKELIDFQIGGDDNGYKTVIHEKIKQAEEYFRQKLGVFEIPTPTSEIQTEPQFNPLPGLIDFDRILNDFMNAHKHEENEKEKEKRIGASSPHTDKILSPKYQHIPPMRSTDAMYKLKADIPLQEDYDRYIQHVNERVYKLHELLEDATTNRTDFKVMIASADKKTCSLGTGLAKKQWIEQGYTYEQYRQFMDHLHQSLKGLKKKYNARVVYGRVSGREASATHYHVWGANTTHMKLKNGQPIDGAGQAEAMETMSDGVFGIVTTPVAGSPTLTIHDEMKIVEYANFTAGLKELAKAEVGSNAADGNDGEAKFTGINFNSDVFSQPVYKTIPEPHSFQNKIKKFTNHTNEVLPNEQYLLAKGLSTENPSAKQKKTN